MGLFRKVLVGSTKVSEELSSMEIFLCSIYYIWQARVSEELSSMEIREHSTKTVFEFALFQKNLVVWKLKKLKIFLKKWKNVSEELSSMEIQNPLQNIINLFFHVSEELSSMEIMKFLAYVRGSTEFQKNLVVWKLITFPWYPSQSLISFQKNLVVWKLTHHQHLFKMPSVFQKNLVVWK